MGCLLWLCLAIAVAVNVASAWPTRYGQSRGGEEPNYYPLDEDDARRMEQDVNQWMNEYVTRGDEEIELPNYPEEDEGKTGIPALTLDELRELVEEAAKQQEDQPNRGLPLARFIPIGPDPTNNGGAGPFKFVKKTTSPVTTPTTTTPTTTTTTTPHPVVVETRSGPLIKKHIATISDETPLYLNYAEKEDGGPHRPVGLQAAAKGDVTPAVKTPTETEDGPARSLEVEPELDVKDLFETFGQDGSAENLVDVQQENEARAAAEEENEAQAAAEEENEAQPAAEEERPEIDFTQRLAFPDLSGTKVLPAGLSELEAAEEEEEKQQPESQEDEKTQESPEEAVPEEANDVPVIEEAQPQRVAPSESVKDPATDDPLVLHVIGEPSPHHLGQNFLPSAEYGFLVKALGEKRAAEPSGGASSIPSGLTLPIVFACTGSILFACIAAAIIHRRNSRKHNLSDAEEPSYGVTGPGPIKPTFLDLSGDRSLAKSAETYHYQHQKRQMLSSQENNPSSGGSTATPRSGDHSDYDSDEEEEEGEDYGDYTVYECPGLAPPGEIEVLNPMFAGGSAAGKDSPAKPNADDE